MRISIHPLLGALALVAFGLISSASAQLTPASSQLMNDYASTPVTSTFRSVPVAPQSSIVADTFYYEDFGDGIADWTFVNVNPDTSQIWEYETVADLSVDNGDARYQVFASPSVGNGFLWFDYRKYIEDNGIVLGQPPYPHLIGTAESPLLDWSNLDLSLKYSLNFFSYQPSLNIRNTRVAIRRPGVADVTLWTTKDEFDRPNTAEQLSIFARVPDDFIGEDSIQILLIHDSDLYGWAVDDILLTALAEIEPQVNDFIAVAPNFFTPASQAAGYQMPFVADIQNNGGETIDISLAVTIFNANDEAIFTDTTRYTGVETDSLRENQVFDNTFALPTEEGTYRGVYEVFTARIDEDILQTNNTQAFTFNISNNRFSKGDFSGGSQPGGGDDIEYSFTNIYYTPNLPDQADSTFQIDSLSFGAFPQDITGTDEAFLDVKVYGFRGDLNGDNLPEYGSESNPDAEMVELASSEYIIDANFTEIPDGAAVTFPASASGPVQLSSTADYVGFAVALTYIPGSGGTNIDNSVFLGTTGRSYSGFGLAAAGAGIVDSLSTILAIDGNAALPAFTFFAGTSPFLDAFISYDVASSAKESVLAESAFSVRPNPATTEFSIDFNFSNIVDVEFEIINAVGQTVSAFERDGLTEGAITIPTQGMNNGLYYIKARTNDGQTATRKLMLKR